MSWLFNFIHQWQIMDTCLFKRMCKICFESFFSILTWNLHFFSVSVFLFSFLCVVGSCTFAAGTMLKGTTAMLPVMLLGRLIFGSGNGSLTSEWCILYLSYTDFIHFSSSGVVNDIDMGPSLIVHIQHDLYFSSAKNQPVGSILFYH